MGPADTTSYQIELNTADLPLGAYDQTITIRTSDPANPERTVHVVGTVTAAMPDTPAGTVQRPLDYTVTIPGSSQPGGVGMSSPTTWDRTRRPCTRSRCTARITANP